MPTPQSDTPAQGPTLEDAAKAFESFLDHENDTGDQSDQAAEVAPTHGESVAAEDEPEETTAQADAGEDEAAESEDGEGSSDAEGPQMVTVTLDGKAVSIPLDEAVKNYQRQADYTRKTTEMARHRQELEAEYKAVREEREQYGNLLVRLREQIDTGDEQEPDWNQVWSDDPIGYARKRDEWRDRREKIAAAQFELQRLHTLRQQEQTENLRKTVEHGARKMREMYPAWRDQKVWDSDREKLVEYLMKPEVGYSREEISAAYDPRAVVLSNKARMWDELMAQKPQPVTRQGPRLASAGAAQPQGTSSRLNSAQQRLARSGSLRDAAKVWEHLL